MARGEEVEYVQTWADLEEAIRSMAAKPITWTTAVSMLEEGMRKGETPSQWTVSAVFEGFPARINVVRCAKNNVVTSSSTPVAALVCARKRVNIAQLLCRDTVVTLVLARLAWAPPALLR